MTIARAGYAAEIRRIEEAVAGAGGPSALDPPTDTERVTRYIYGLYQRASISGDPAALGEVEHALAQAVPLVTHPGDLYFLKANLAFKLHRLDDVEAALVALPSAAQNAEARLIRADLDFQRGRYREAEAGYRDVLHAEKSWGALARLAHFTGKMGDTAAADDLYEEAQDELTAKELRSFAWLEVQRGFLDFCRGRLDEARAHYRRADAAYPGYWLVEEHIAELLGAEGRYGEAIAILKKWAAAGNRPDLAQAIAELHRLAGETDPALQWAQQALAGYLRSAEQGAVHYYHHLVDYYAEVEEDGAVAVAWAQKDLQLRQNFSTQAALAWAFFRARRFDEARPWIDRALGSGVVDPRIFLQAGAIYTAIGEKREAKSFEERARRLNPMVDRCHLHH
ncbi:MAG TPA: hypothetical protein VGF34_02500 [Stellaceae bacterium]